MPDNEYEKSFLPDFLTGLDDSAITPWLNEPGLTHNLTLPNFLGVNIDTETRSYLTRGGFTTLNDSYQEYLKAKKDYDEAGWSVFGRKRRKAYNTLQDASDKFNLTLASTKLKYPGVENSVPSLNDESEASIKKKTEADLDASAEKEAEVRQNTKDKVAKWSGAVGSVFSIADPFVKDRNDAGGGSKGYIYDTANSTYDAAAGAALQSGNPWLMMAGAGMKGLGMANKAIGNSTDGMTSTDAFLDSNWGFLATGGLSKLNSKYGDTTDKFTVDEDIKKNLGASYTGTYDNLDYAASRAGKRYGWLSGKALSRALADITEANYTLGVLSDINDNAQTRNMAAGYSGISTRNQSSLNGGYLNSFRAAKKGMKFKLDFARKAALGFKFNDFEFVNWDKYKPTDSYYEDRRNNLGDPFYLGEDLKKSKDDKVTVNVGLQDPGNKPGDSPTDNTSEKITLDYIGEDGTRVIESIEKGMLKIAEMEINDLYDKDSDGTYILPSEPSPRTKAVLEAAGIKYKVASSNTSEANPLSIEDDDYLGGLLLLNDTIPSMVNTEASRNDAGTAGSGGGGGGGRAGSWKNGGSLVPLSDEDLYNYQLQFMKEGGQFNIIPEGALHKNKHHMEGAEGLTKKGIPVVTIEDGKKIQLAEIERDEIIFRLEVTSKLEELAKKGTDEAAIEAGKLLTLEILHNTHDNTGLLKET